MLTVINMARRSSRLAMKHHIDYNEVKVMGNGLNESVPHEKKALTEIEKPLTGRKKATKVVVKKENGGDFGNSAIIKPSKQEARSPKKDSSIKNEILKSEDGNKMLECCSPQMLIGCHTSISGGLWKSVEEAKLFGAEAFAMFLHSQQQWKMKPLKDSDAQRFRDTCAKLGYLPNQIVPHGSYLMNCGSPREDVKEKSDAMLIEELKRCEELGLIYFNFHPGSTLGKISVGECLSAIATSINKAHHATKYVIALLENMSCQGNTVGGKFQELRDIIEMVKDKSRIGVCIDTCHAHAAGYDLSTPEGYNIFTKDLETIIGLKYVKAFHLNDSKGPSGCNKDRHENIGKGTIGLKGFERLVNDARFLGIPMILETPYKNDDIYKKEIKLLYSLIK